MLFCQDVHNLCCMNFHNAITHRCDMFFGCSLPLFDKKEKQTGRLSVLFTARTERALGSNELNQKSLRNYFVHWIHVAYAPKTRTVYTLLLLVVRQPIHEIKMWFQQRYLCVCWVGISCTQGVYVHITFAT